jgi:hypothetical protein
VPERAARPRFPRACGPDQDGDMPIVRSLRGRVFSPEERADVVARFWTAWAVQEAAEDAGDHDGAARARVQVSAVAREYEQGVPIVEVARSPFNGRVFQTSLDIDGLDGPWWAYEYEFRPYIEPVQTFFAWTGSMRFDGPVPTVPLQMMVGPDAPFVLPRMLEHPDVRAVLSSVLVGEHIGFPVVYFADPTPYDLERVDDWGHREHQYVRADGTPTSEHSIQVDDDKDLDLGPWLDSNKLLWIEPGDTTLTLRRGRTGCPFVGLPGRRDRQYVRGGRVVV